eukprot:scaffold371364_cov76-Cyclotella_meneghiniana.AAC.1
MGLECVSITRAGPLEHDCELGLVEGGGHHVGGEKWQEIKKSNSTPSVVSPNWSGRIRSLYRSYKRPPLAPSK